MTQTTLQRIFLGWDQPLLQASVNYLHKRYGSSKSWDLSATTLVVPTSRSRRQLIALLKQHAATEQLDLQPPRILTVGTLPEQLYQPAGELALELEQTLAWTQVLLATDPQRLKALLPSIPPHDPIAPWVELAASLRRLHDTLAADNLRFADVIAFVETAAEKDRWQLLDELLDAYRGQLKAAGRLDPAAARQTAIETGGCGTDRQIILIGAADLSGVLCKMLDTVASQVTSLVGAAESDQVLFDRYGRVEPQEWAMRDLPWRDEQLLQADDASDQAAVMANQVLKLQQTFRPDQITVGVTDDSLVTFVETELEQCNLATHREQGWPLSQTAPGRFLRLLSMLRTRMDWNSLAALVRHSDVYDWLDRQLSAENEESGIPKTRRDLPWLTQLDHFLGNHYPTKLDVAIPAVALDDYPVLPALLQRVTDWLAPLLAPPKSLAKWSQSLLRVIDAIYPPVEEFSESDASDSGEFGADEIDAVSSEDIGVQRTRFAIDRMHVMLERLETLSDVLDVPVPAAVAMEMLLGRLAEAPIVLASSPEKIEILGWLELALDDSEGLVVVGLNHPYVPESITADPFLPGSLRSRLNMADNERRFARDAYALHSILSTRPDTRFIVGRRGPDGSPTPPSRLLSAASGADLARRIMQLLSAADSPRVTPPSSSGEISKTSLPIPVAGKADIKVMSVTAFSAYLACPFRFYLRHVLGLRPQDDQSRELQANQFGDLVHGALEDFGDNEDHRQATKASEIEELLLQYLYAYAKKRFGEDPAAAVQVQIHQAERRLKVVASRQAERRAEGWEIRYAEASVDPKPAADGSPGAGIQIGDRRMGLKGRFDRIDYHPQTGQWAILDYKTHGHLPRKKHIDSTSGEWVDLQLPLYRLMTEYIEGVDAPADQIQLGYFNIADQADATGIHLADFTETEFEAAEKLVKSCIERIWDNDFAPSADPVPFDDYAMICQTGLAATLLDSFSLPSVEEASQ